MNLPLPETATFFGVRTVENLVCVLYFFIWVIKAFYKFILLFSIADITDFSLSFR